MTSATLMVMKIISDLCAQVTLGVRGSITAAAAAILQKEDDQGTE